MNSAVNWQVNALVEATPISGPGVRQKRSRGLARDHRADHVADGERLRALLLGFALGRQRIGGFAGLRDHDGQRVRSDDRIAVAELAAVVHFDRDARQLLDHEFAGQRRMPTGAASDDLDLLEIRGTRFGEISISSRKMRPVSWPTRPSRVSRTARGCSKISLSMKCL